MSEKVARAVRRDLRRTIGPEALSALHATTLAVNHQVLPNINSLQARTANMDERVALLERQVERLSADLRDLTNFQGTITTHIARLGQELSAHSHLQWWWLSLRQRLHALWSA